MHSLVHLQLLLLLDCSVTLSLQEAGVSFQLAHDGRQLLVADLLPYNVLAVGVDLVLYAALLLMLLSDGILQCLHTSCTALCDTPPLPEQHCRTMRPQCLHNHALLLCDIPPVPV